MIGTDCIVVDFMHCKMVFWWYASHAYGHRVMCIVTMQLPYTVLLAYEGRYIAISIWCGCYDVRVPGDMTTLTLCGSCSATLA